MSEYQPISCGLHSEYELFAMHRQKISLVFVNERGEKQHMKGQVLDVQTKNGAEYLCVKGEASEQQRIRLDRIQSTSISS